MIPLQAFSVILTFLVSFVYFAGTKKRISFFQVALHDQAFGVSQSSCINFQLKQS
jgi:hypothetical protein